MRINKQIKKRYNECMEHNNIKEKIDKKEKIHKSNHSELEAEIEKLKKEVEVKGTEAKENKEIAQRIKAEFDNYKKRIIKDYEENIKLASEGLIRDLIPVLDNFERALTINNIMDEKFKSFYSGIELVSKKFKDIMTNNGLKEITPDKGTEFDPTYHDAVIVETGADYKTEVVLELLEKGYLISRKLIRPAKVKVGKPLIEKIEEPQIPVQETMEADITDGKKEEVE